MELHLVRHAIATERSNPALDHARPLTPEGRGRFARAVRGLGRLGFRFDALLHGPWTRAVQTADLLEPLLDGPRGVEAALAAPPGPDLLERVQAFAAPEARLALVGHEPWLGELAAWLAFGDPSLGPGLEVKKGAVLVLRGDPSPGGCVLAAQLPPRVLRRCGGQLK